MAKFCCVLLPLEGPIRNRLLQLAESVPDEDLAEDGRELDPHLTLLYGLHDPDPVPAEELLARVRRPIRFRLGKVSLFRGAETGRDYDVLKVDVDSPDLHVLNRLLKTLPHTQTHSEYRPHATLAFLKPGLGEKWVRKFGSLDLKGQSQRLLFSDTDHQTTEINVGADRPVKFAKSKPQSTLRARLKQLGKTADFTLSPADILTPDQLEHDKLLHAASPRTLSPEEKESAGLSLAVHEQEHNRPHWRLLGAAAVRNQAGKDLGMNPQARPGDAVSVGRPGQGGLRMLSTSFLPAGATDRRGVPVEARAVVGLHYNAHDTDQPGTSFHTPVYSKRDLANLTQGMNPEHVSRLNSLLHPHLPDKHPKDYQGESEGAVDWRPTESIPEDFYAASRRQMKLKFEAGSQRVHHPLVAGFRLARVLDHLHGSRDSSPDVKLLASRVLHDGDSTALRPLYDALQDQDHRLAHSYNWPAAEWKLHLDSAVGTGLDAIRNHYTELGFDPKEARTLAVNHLRNANQNHNPQYVARGVPADPDAADLATEVTGLLKQQGHGKEDLAESLNRHQLRHSDPSDRNQQAVTEKPERDALEVASRYARQQVKVPIHPIVRGTRLATVLKHLTKTGNGGTKQLAVKVLRDGDTNALAVLGDWLEENDADHPLTGKYDLRGASRKLHLDSVLHPQLDEKATSDAAPGMEESRRELEGDFFRSHLKALRLVGQDPRNPPPDSEYHAILSNVNEKFPDYTDEELDASLRRHRVKHTDNHMKTRFGERTGILANLNDNDKREVQTLALSGSSKPYSDSSPSETKFLTDPATVNALTYKFSRSADSRRGGFLQALKRVQSRQQHDLRKLAENLYQNLGLKPVTVRDAIHDFSGVASAGTAHSLVHDSDPDLARYAAATYGLASQAPSLLLFHVGDGPDSMHKVEVRGSGEGLLKQLDRLGLKQRTLIPTKTGYHTFIADRGSQLGSQVQQFAQKVGGTVTTVKGSGELLGGGSDSAAGPDDRSSYRGVIRSWEGRNKQQPQDQNSARV